MDKTINERLFEQLMRAPHAVRRLATEEGMEERRPHGPGHDRHCPHGEGHGPHGAEPGECRRNEFAHGQGRECPHGEGHGPHGPMHDEGHCPHGAEHGGRHGRGFARERVLRMIGSFEGGVRQKVLTEELRINPSSVSEMVSKLERDGYVRRTVDPADKRATLITLTELGEARAAELQDEKDERYARMFGNLTDEEKEQLIALLEKLTADR